MSIAILAPGMLTTVQDGGRYGHAALGVGVGGAMDTVALRLANSLVGNGPNAAVLEITLRGPRLRFDRDALIAFAGAQLDVRCGDAVLPGWCPIALRAGSEIVCGGMRRGARSYLAVAGGIDTAPLLGSRSADVNAGLGAPLAAGARLAHATPPGDATLWSELRDGNAAFVAAKWALDPAPWFDASGQQPVHAVRGAHFAHLDATSQRALFTRELRIGADANRVGYRLQGMPLVLREALELVSEGVVPGTVQLPPGGAPIVLMAEAPTSGGYPRIAQIAALDLPRLAQRRPGDALRLVEISLAEAQTRYLERERALAALARNVLERLHG